MIKRVIGLPGENVKIDSGSVYIDDQKLKEDYLPAGTYTETDPSFDAEGISLAADEYFVLGDNRAVSKDSRYIGPVKKHLIIGKVLFKFYPLNEIGIPK